MLIYKETLDWLFSQLPMYQQQGISAYKVDLTNTLLLVDYLNNPHQKIKCIHVAGTNGKGSVTHMLSSILQESGYKVGLYTSPHLIDFRERIKIGNKEIPESYVVDFVAKHRRFFEKHQLSFFEMTVGLAFDYFVSEEIDIAVIEVGLGGRLDATNVITPLVSVITTIGLDHTQILGDTLAKIASEKAGIVKHKIPVVIGEYTNETRSVFEIKSQENEAPLFWASSITTDQYSCDLKGDYQKSNIKTAVETIRVLNQFYDYKINPNTIQQGLSNVVKNTGLLGRWQVIQNYPLVVCDTAHNKQGLSIVTRQIQNQNYEKLFIIMGFVDDKNLDEILPLFPIEAKYLFIKPQINRGLNAAIVQQKAKVFGLEGDVYDSVDKAFKKAIESASENDFIYIGGSTFVVGDFLSFFSCKE